MADFGTVARPYARALFDLASANGELEKWSSALAAAAAIVNDPLAKRSLARPDLGDRQRIDFVQGACQDLSGGKAWASPRGAQSARRFSSRTIASPRSAKSRTQFDELKAAAENTVKATLVSAVAVDERDRRQGRNGIAEEARAHGRAHARGGSHDPRRRNHPRRGHGHRRLGAHALGAARRER